MKVKIDCDKRVKARGSTEYEGGWFYATTKQGSDGHPVYDTKSDRFATYAEVKAAAVAAGHEISNDGWKHKLLMWNWHSHLFDGYTGWELEKGHPAWCKLEHVNKKTKSSEDLCNAWDDIATVDFYSRDYSYDGSVFVNDGEAYGSGWWFATIAERDRFLAWAREQLAVRSGMPRLKRYVRLIGSMVVRTAGTLDELFAKELEAWRSNGFCSRPVDYVDTWNEPGRLVVEHHGIVTWEPA